MSRLEISGTLRTEGLRLLWRRRAQHASWRFRKFVDTFELRYSPDQPRIPAGQPGVGQWIEGGEENDDTIASPVGDSAEASTVLAGGFASGDSGRTVQDFMSENCKGSIRAEMPSQFLDMTIGEVQSLPKSGDADARICIKLLGRDKYRK